MTPQDMDDAIRTAVEADLKPTIFKIRAGADSLRPGPQASRRGIPVDPTSQRSHLLCEGGRKIMIEGEWS